MRAVQYGGLAIDTSSLPIEHVLLFDLGAVANAKAAKTAVGHAGMETRFRNPELVSIFLPCGPEKFDDHAADLHDLLSVGLNAQTFLDGKETGSYEPDTPAANDLDHAHAAGAVGLEAFVVAEGRDIDSGRFGCLQDCGAFRSLDGLAVDFERYLFHVILP